jgi:hypothetical protein
VSCMFLVSVAALIWAPAVYKYARPLAKAVSVQRNSLGMLIGSDDSGTNSSLLRIGKHGDGEIHGGWGSKGCTVKLAIKILVQ